MKFNECVRPDVCQTAVESAPALRATLYHRRRKVAEKRLHECSGLSWSTPETLSCVSDRTVTCMGVFILFLFLHCLLRKWRRHKGAYPNASHYASRASVVHNKVAGKVYKIWRRHKRALVFRLKIWCLVYYYIIYGKLYRARNRIKKKLTQLVHHIKSVYMKAAFSIYRRLPTLRVSAVVMFLWLFMSGDIELNPGPKEGQLTINDLKFVRSTIWEARCKWMDIGIELSLNKSDLDALEETNGANIGKCLTEMISLWLKRTDPPPTMSAMVTALNEPAVGLQQLADQINRHSNASTSKTITTDNETDQLSFPHISKVAPDEQTRQLLEGRLREESLDIMQDFRVLLNKFFDSLEDQNYSVKRLTRYLEDAFNDNREKLATMEDVQSFIKQRSSFYDYRLVKYMINLAGTVEDKERQEKYEQTFLCYAKRRIYECPSTFKTIGTSDDIELYVKLDLEYDKCRLEELQGFQNRLSSILQINVYYCLLSKAKEGCFELTFIIPRHIQKATFPLSSKQQFELKELKVVYIMCDDKYQLPPSKLFSSEESDNDSLHSIGMVAHGGYAAVIPEPPRRSQSVPLRIPRRRHTGRSDASSCATESMHGSGFESGEYHSDIVSVESGLSHHPMSILCTPASAYGSGLVPPTNFKDDIDRIIFELETFSSPDPSAPSAYSLCKIFTPMSCIKELHMAASFGNLVKVKSLIESCNYVHYCVCRDNNGNAALHHAAMNGHLNIVQYLTDIEEVNPASPGEDGMTPLHFASMYGYLDIVAFLIDKQSVDPLCYNIEKQTPFFLACKYGHLEVAKTVLEALLIYMKLEDIIYETDSSNITVIHAACLHNRLNIVNWLLSTRKCDPSTLGCMNRTPLHYSAEQGHLEIVRCLIETYQCNPSCQDTSNVTPLHLASLNGHLNVVKYLTIERGCDPNCFTSTNISPIYTAVCSGQLEVVNFFISEMNCNHNEQDRLNRQLLHAAAENGHLNILKFLIEDQHCNPSCQDSYKVTPLHLASKNGHINIVKYLTQEESCNPTCRNSDGETPFHACVRFGDLDLVQFFISELNCDPCMKGWQNQQPIHIAAHNGHLNLVKYLIEHQNCDPSCQDAKNITPLHLASLNGHMEIVRYLLIEKGCDPACRDSDNNTPLHVSAFSGHLEVVRYLMRSYPSACHSATTGWRGRQPLHYAAYNGHLQIVKYLIESDGLSSDPSCRDIDNLTPLHLASMNGHLDIVEYLTTEKMQNSAVIDSHNDTPLHAAALNGHLEVVNFLVSRLNSDPSIEGEQNRQPLHLSAQNGHLHLTKYLIEDLHCDPSCQDAGGITPLHLASMNGFLDTIEYLVVEAGCDPTCKAFDGNTPLHVATINGHMDIVTFFTSVLTCDPAVSDGRGRQPLHAAAENGFLPLVKYLVSKDQNCDPSCVDINDITPLHLASFNGHLGIVRYLILEKGCDPMCANVNNDLPIHAAALNGQLETVKYFVSELKCHPNTPGSAGKRVIHFAAQGGNLSLLKYLIEKLECSPNSLDSFNRTPLVFASQHSVNLVDYLISENHCDPKFITATGDIALHFAAYAGQMDVLDYLIDECGCYPDIPGWSGRTPLHYAIESAWPLATCSTFDQKIQLPGVYC